MRLRTSSESQQLPSIAIGLAGVEHHCIRMKFQELQFGVMAIGSFRDNVSLCGEEIGDAGANDRIGIDDQNSMLTQALTCSMTRKDA